jgi:PGF-CTERM protein
VTVETDVAFDDPGEHTVSAGDRSVTVTVGEPTTETGTEPLPVDGQPGFGAVAAVLALFGLGLLSRRE